MCIESAAQVLVREGDEVVVDCDGKRRRASSLLMPDLVVGDWVFVVAGTVIDRLDPAEAQRINAELRQARESIS